MFIEYYPFLNLIAEIAKYLMFISLPLSYLYYWKERLGWFDIRFFVPLGLIYVTMGWVIPVRKVLVYINQDGLSVFDAITQLSSLWSIAIWIVALCYTTFGVYFTVVMLRERRRFVRQGFTRKQIQAMFREMENVARKPGSGGFVLHRRYDKFISSDGDLSVAEVTKHIGKPKNARTTPKSMLGALENMRQFIVPFAIASSVEKDGTGWRIRPDYKDLILQTQTSQLAAAMEFEEGGTKHFPILFRFVEVTDSAPIPHSILIQFATYLQMTKAHIEKNPNSGAGDQTLFYFLFLLALNARYLDCYLGLLIDTIELELKPQPKTLGEWRKVAEANLKRHQDEYKQHLRDLGQGAFKELFEERFNRRDIELLIFSVFAEAGAIDAETPRDPVYIPKELAQSIADVFQENPISDGSVPKGESIH